HAAIRSRHRGVVVEIRNVLRSGVALQPVVERANLPGWIAGRGLPRIPRGGQHRGKYDADVVGAREVYHRAEVVFDHRLRLGPGVAGDVVGAGKNHYGLRVQIDHVLAEAHHHLLGRLAADAAIDVRLAGAECAAVTCPAVGDGVAIEDHATHLSCRQRGVRIGVAAKLRPVVDLLLHHLAGSGRGLRARGTLYR